MWPEEVLPFDPRTEHAAQVAGIARSNHVYLVAPFTVGQEPSSPNKALVLGPDGQTLGVYNKVHPVVVEGEGFDQPFLPLAFPADFGTFGVAICFDNHYLDVVPAVVQNGARLIAMPSLIWPGEAKNQLAEVVFRAVENRVAYAKAELGWSSAIVAPDGSVRAVTMPQTQPSWALLVADVPHGARPLAVRVGGASTSVGLRGRPRGVRRRLRGPRGAEASSATLTYGGPRLDRRASRLGEPAVRTGPRRVSRRRAPAAPLAQTASATSSAGGTVPTNRHVWPSRSHVTTVRPAAESDRYSTPPFTVLAAAVGRASTGLSTMAYPTCFSPPA